MRLEAVPKERIWGTTDTEPWFPNPERRRIGEVWFRVPDSCPLLVKFLFTSDSLSVQVHPSDEGEHRGKTEMWHVLRAEKDARVAIGVNREVTADELHNACSSGEIMDLLRWVPARVGDTFFIPAGTVHALGAGLVVCEIQQNSDRTYRLYDYGRDRELHLHQGLAVSDLKPYDGRTELPLQCEYFRVSDGASDEMMDRDRFLVAIGGEEAGQVFALSAGVPSSMLGPGFLLTSAPGLVCSSVI